MSYLARLKNLKGAETHPTKTTKTLSVVSVAPIPAPAENSWAVLGGVGEVAVRPLVLPSNPVHQPQPDDLGLSVGTVGRFGDGVSPFAACNDPTAQLPAPAQHPAPAAIEVNKGLVNSGVNTKTADWADLDREYQTHHWTCAACIAAGQGRGLRCGTGAALWAAYSDVEPLHGKFAARVPTTTSTRKDGIHPSLLTPATSVEIDTMVARLALFDARGVHVDDAERLVDKLLVRDREGDRRGACAECVHLVGSGPGRWRCSDRAPTSHNDLAGASVGAGFVHLQLHHCPGLEGKTT